MLRRHSQLLMLVVYVNDAATVSAAWLLAYYLRFRCFPYGLDGPAEISGYLYPLPIIAMIWFASYRHFGIYRSKRLNPVSFEIWDITKASLWASLIFLTATFFYRGTSYSRVAFAVFVTLDVAFMAINRAALRTTLRYLRRRGYNKVNVLVVGAGEHGRKVARKLEAADWAGMNVVGFLDDDRPAGTEVMGRPVLGGLGDAEAAVRGHDVAEVFIAMPMGGQSRLPEVLGLIERTDANARVVPDMHQAPALNAGVEVFDGMPILNIIDPPFHALGFLMKRVFDLFVSAASLAALSPLMLLIAALVKATSRGPVLFRQERMSLNGVKFMMYKFRTMNATDEAERDILTKKGDKRVTGVGGFLRRTSLDELPQLINVLKGDMSIVGPRPERTWVVEEVRERVPRYMLKHKVRSGITGWAQVNGWRGDTSLEKRIDHDIFYIENWSLLFDAKIMLLTLVRTLSDKNAY